MRIRRMDAFDHPSQSAARKHREISIVPLFLPLPFSSVSSFFLFLFLSLSLFLHPSIVSVFDCLLVCPHIPLACQPVLLTSWTPTPLLPIHVINSLSLSLFVLASPSLSLPFSLSTPSTIFPTQCSIQNYILPLNLFLSLSLIS